MSVFQILLQLIEGLEENCCIEEITLQNFLNEEIIRFFTIGATTINLFLKEQPDVGAIVISPQYQNSITYLNLLNCEGKIIYRDYPAEIRFRNQTERVTTNLIKTQGGLARMAGRVLQRQKPEDLKLAPPIVLRSARINPGKGRLSKKK